MDFNKGDLTAALNKVAPAIDKKGEAEVSNRFIFTGADVAGYNDDFAIISPMQTDFVTTVASEELLKIVGRIKDETIALVYSKDQLGVNGGNVRSRLKTEPLNTLLPAVQELAAMADSDEAQWYTLPPEFTDGVKLCMYSASTDPTEKHLQCVFFNGPVIVGSDDFRISVYTMQTGATEHYMLIPARVCMEMVKLGPITQYAVVGSWALFINASNDLFCARLAAVDYDDYTRFFDMENTRTLVLPKDELLEVIDTVGVMADGEHEMAKEIKVTVSKGTVTLRGEKDLGWLEATVKKDTKNVLEDVVFGINPTFFADILRLTQNVEVGTGKALFTAPEGNFRHLVSLGIV